MNARTDTRQVILNSAAELFHAHNYSDIGVARVCEKAGVSKGSFFHFFPTKKDLALAVIDHVSEAMAEQVIKSAFSPRIPPMERIERFVDALYQQQVAEKKAFGNVLGCPFGNLILEQGARDETIRVKTRQVMETMTGQIRTALADAKEAGDLHQTIDLEETALAMMSYLEGLQLMSKSSNDPEIMNRLGPSVTSIQISRGI